MAKIAISMVVFVVTLGRLIACTVRLSMIAVFAILAGLDFIATVVSVSTGNMLVLQERNTVETELTSVYRSRCATASLATLGLLVAPLRRRRHPRL